MADGEREFCANFQRAIELVGKRWSGTILRALLARPLRFSEVAASIPEISDRALSARLKELESEGVVLRTVEPTTPVSVRYELTASGRDLESAIAAVEGWAERWVAPGRARRNDPPATPRRSRARAPTRRTRATAAGSSERATSRADR